MDGNKEVSDRMEAVLFLDALKELTLSETYPYY